MQSTSKEGQQSGHAEGFELGKQKSAATATEEGVMKATRI
jgi:hypothetical protein